MVRSFPFSAKSSVEPLQNFSSLNIFFFHWKATQSGRAGNDILLPCFRFQQNAHQTFSFISNRESPHRKYKATQDYYGKFGSIQGVMTSLSTSISCFNFEKFLPSWCWKVKNQKSEILTNSFIYCHCRSSQRRCSVKIVFLKFRKFYRKTLALKPFFNKVAGIHSFPVNIAKCLSTWYSLNISSGCF